MSNALNTLNDQGFVVLKGLLNKAQLQDVRGCLDPFLKDGPAGRNDFEGEKTQRVYSLIAKGKPFCDMVLHPQVLALMDALLWENYLLTASQAIVIHPGETPQPFHFDDAFYGTERPRPPISVSTIWAIDDFTAENGATAIIPESQKWSMEDRPADWESRAQPALMDAGDCIVFLGTTVHRGGANRSAKPRRAISHQYCMPWARQQENYFLSIPKDVARDLPERARQLLGYSIHPPFMGQIAGRHPQKYLDDALPEWPKA